MGNGAAWAAYFIFKTHATISITFAHNASQDVCNEYHDGVLYGYAYHYEAPTFDPQKEKALGANCNLVGNPCNPATGNKYQSENDYPGNAGTVRFVRHYNSQLNQDLGFGLGFGWLSTFHKRLEIYSGGVQVRHSDGRGEPFTLSTSGLWQSDPDSQLALTQDTTGYTLTRSDNSTERYDLNGRLASETSSMGQVTTYGYDASGRLATMTGPFGHALTFSYDTSGYVSTVTDPSGKIILYGYDSKGNLSRVDYPDGTARIYHYNESVYTGGANIPHHITGISYVDASGTTTRFSAYRYNNLGKAVGTEHAITDNGTPQEKLSLTYNSDTKTTVTDAVSMQEVMTFAINLGVKNLVSKVNQTDSKSVTQAFDGNNNLTCKKDEENRVTIYSYNGTNQKLSMTEGLSGTDCNICIANPANCNVGGVGRVTTYDYLSLTLDLPRFIRRPSVASGQTFETELQYGDTNHPNLPTQIIQRGFTPSNASVSRTVALGYNASGQVNSINGPRTDVSDITTLEYYACTTGGACGQLQRITNALGHITTYDFYDANGRLLQMTDPNGLRTGYTYDARGRVKTITQTPTSGPAALTQYSYTPWGDVSQVIDPDGVVLNYQYDAAHGLRYIVDAVGNYIYYTHDLKGNRTGENIYDNSGNLMRTVGFAYDLRNRLSSIASIGNFTQLVHDAVGNLISESPNADGVNRTMTHEYDALNRLMKTVDAVNGTGAPTVYGHDVNDRPAAVTAPNHLTTSYTVDDLGNRRREVSPDRGTLRYTYDTASNVLTELNALGQTTTYAYDALNRLISQQSDAPATPRYTYEYDSCGVGYLCIVRESGYLHLMYTYDGLGRPSSLLDANSFTASYLYTSAGRLKRITYPGGRTVDYQYNSVGRVKQVSTTANGTTTVLASAIRYNPFGPVNSLAYGNGLQRSVLLDSAYRNYLRTDGPFLEYTTAYDGADNPTGRALAGGNQALGYDPLNRLTSATDTQSGAYGSLSYLYDGNGNRRSETRNGVTTGYTYTPAGSNGLNAVGGEIRVRDAAGNTIFTSLLGSLGYDGYGRLTGAGGGSYRYNALHQRIQKTVGSSSTLFVYGPRGELLYENDNGVGRAYVYLEDVPLARVTGSTVLYYHTDHLGTPQRMTNAQGITVWKASYEPFGRATVNEDPDGNGVLVKNNVGLAGMYADAETGLFYGGARYYDPKTGRWITVEPLGVVSGVGDSPRVPREITKYFQSIPLNGRLLDGLNHPYNYAYNNPLRYIDPNGLMGYSPGPDQRRGGVPGFGLPALPGPFGPVCGSGYSATWIPDGPWKGACQKHDDCYSRCGASRLDCDIKFLFDSYGNVTYFFFVRRFGEQPFQDAQKESCCDQKKQGGTQ